MFENTRTVAPEEAPRRNRGWFPKLAVAGLLAAATLMAMPGVSSAYPLIGS